jgi:hypothetical protein
LKGGAEEIVYAMDLRRGWDRPRIETTEHFDGSHNGPTATSIVSFDDNFELSSMDILKRCLRQWNDSDENNNTNRQPTRISNGQQNVRCYFIPNDVSEHQPANDNHGKIK